MVQCKMPVALGIYSNTYVHSPRLPLAWCLMSSAAGFIFNHWSWTHILIKSALCSCDGLRCRRTRGHYDIHFFSLFSLLCRNPFGLEAFAKYCLHRNQISTRIHVFTSAADIAMELYGVCAVCAWRWKNFQKKTRFVFISFVGSTIRLNSCLHLATP